MNKVVLKEFKKEHICFKIIFYILFVSIGLELLHFSNIGLTNPINYIPLLFYIFALLSFITYFVNRVAGNYELLFFGIINILTGTFAYLNINYPDSGFILSDTILLYSLLNVANNGYSCSKLRKEKNISIFIKIAITVMLLFLGVFVVSAVYDKITYGMLILGYYFMAFGLLKLLEILVTILLKNKKLQNYLLSYIYYDEDGELKEKKAVKNRTIKKIKRK